MWQSWDLLVLEKDNTDEYYRLPDRLTKGEFLF